MKKLILPFAIATLVALFVIIYYASNREAPKSGVAGDTMKERDTSRGVASFYGVSTNGTRTASGIPLDDSASTAAHRALPFGTRVRVTNLSNGLSEIVEITDRGPFTKGRIIDLSLNAAEKLNMIEAGIVSVEVEVLPAASGSN